MSAPTRNMYDSGYGLSLEVFTGGIKLGWNPTCAEIFTPIIGAHGLVF